MKIHKVWLKIKAQTFKGDLSVYAVKVKTSCTDTNTLIKNSCICNKLYFRKWHVRVIDINTRGGRSPSGFMSIMGTSHFLNILHHGQPETNI